MELRRDLVVTSSASLVPEKKIQQVKGLIESRQFLRALKLINMLLPHNPSSAYLLALKALVYVKIGLCDAKALSLCEASKNNFLTDTSVLPKVLSTLQTVCHLLGKHNLAIGYYKYALEVSQDSDLMKGLFYCYHRESLFVDQLEISFKMYDSNKKLKFLLWSVFSIQLQVCCQVLEKYITFNEIDEPEKFLVYISVTEQKAVSNAACEILSKLGPTLLVAEVGRRRRIEGLRLVARVSDYTAAVLFMEQYQSHPDNRVRIINSMRDSSGPHTSLLVCISSLLFEDECDLEMSKVITHAALRGGRDRCCDQTPWLDKAVNKYFNRHGSNTEVRLQVFTKEQELLLIDNLLEEDRLTPNSLQKEFSSLLNISRVRFSGFITPGLHSRCHGTLIALKTEKFIILAADGKLTSSKSYDALTFKADKLKDIDGMCVAVTGDWKNTSRMLSSLSTCRKLLEEEGKGRPTVENFADFANEKLCSNVSDIGLLFGAFDQSKDGQVVPCIFYVDECVSFEITESFYCAGTGYLHARQSLQKEGKVREDMELAEAISLVEKALARANIGNGGCTGGWASIHVIKKDGTITRMPREHISSTLRRRHFSSSVFEDA